MQCVVVHTKQLGEHVVHVLAQDGRRTAISPILTLRVVRADGWIAAARASPGGLCRARRLGTPRIVVTGLRRQAAASAIVPLRLQEDVDAGRLQAGRTLS